MTKEATNPLSSIMRSYNFWVYIVECSDRSFYTGVTNNLERRLDEHNSGSNSKCYTYPRRPVVLKYEQQFDQINDAIAWEKQIKGWNRQKKKALIAGDIEKLKELSKGHSSSSSE